MAQGCEDKNGDITECQTKRLNCENTLIADQTRCGGTQLQLESTWRPGDKIRVLCSIAIVEIHILLPGYRERDSALQMSTITNTHHPCLLTKSFSCNDAPHSGKDALLCFER
eukprot:1012827-Pleurochrysis_carterae.AAC.5